MLSLICLCSSHKKEVTVDVTAIPLSVIGLVWAVCVFLSYGIFKGQMLKKFVVRYQSYTHTKTMEWEIWKHALLGPIALIGILGDRFGDPEEWASNEPLNWCLRVPKQYRPQ